MAEKGVIVLVRHESYHIHFYNCVLGWLQKFSPQTLDRFRLATLPLQGPADAEVRLVVMWLQDPVESWSQETYVMAEMVADHYERKGVPVINRPRHTSKSIKSVAAPLVASAGLRVPRMARLENSATVENECARVGFPLFIREDQGHGSAMVLARTMDDLRSVDLRSFHRPVAVEYIDTADPIDGLFRKYRHFACGDIGVPHHLQASAEWIVRGENRVINETTKQQELSYIGQEDPHHERFQAARRALELDVAAFDFSFDREGRLVVWEVNPFAFIQFGRKTTAYRNHAIHRTIAAMVTTYLERAGFPVPDEVSRWLPF